MHKMYYTLYDDKKYKLQKSKYISIIISLDELEELKDTNIEDIDKLFDKLSIKYESIIKNNNIINIQEYVS